MKITFLGVGEAFDPLLGNTSILVQSKDTCLLVDCGYAVPRTFFELEFSLAALDVIYLTHFHADHTFGLPVFITRAMEEGRSRPLHLVGQPGLQQFVTALMNIAYPSILSRLNFELAFHETAVGASIKDLELKLAASAHGLQNFAVKITSEGTSIAHSGDGALTDETRRLYTGCSGLIHEAFSFDGVNPGHASAIDVFRFAKSLPGLQTLAFTHLQRDVRRNELLRFVQLCETAPFDVLVPEAGDQLIFPEPTK